MICTGFVMEGGALEILKSRRTVAQLHCFFQKKKHIIFKGNAKHERGGLNPQCHALASTACGREGVPGVTECRVKHKEEPSSTERRKTAEEESVPAALLYRQLPGPRKKRKWQVSLESSLSVSPQHHHKTLARSFRERAQSASM